MGRVLSRPDLFGDVADVGVEGTGSFALQPTTLPTGVGVSKPSRTFR
jgi:hypothetical protein